MEMFFLKISYIGLIAHQVITMLSLDIIFFLKIFPRKI